MYDLVIKNGTVVTAAHSFAADVAVQGERIAAVGQDLRGKRELDAAGKLVTPGAVDIHVHLEMDLGNGLVSSDDFFSGTRAAALGGTTTVVDFVAPQPEESLLDALAARRAAADGRVVIDYGLHMTIGPAEIGKLDQLAAVYAAGCASFKLYMAYGFRLNDGELLLALEAVRDVGGLPVIHAENWDVIQTLAARCAAQGRTTPHWHPRSRPAPLEAEAAGRAIDLAAFVGTPLHIFHVSCAAVVERIAAARRRGLPITGETCPQYLFLTEEAYDAPGLAGALPVCAPPLRPAADQRALWRALADGDLQLVTTDHCPFTQADKARGRADFRLIPGGVPSIEMRFAALYSQGVGGGWLSPSQWVDLCCTTPARLVGLPGKGEILPGYDADLVIFDPARQVVLSTETLHERVDWTPYDGITLQGWPEMAFSRGRLIVDRGEFKGQAGDGRFIKTNRERLS
jgi:dihydropyrimidinase